MEKNKTVTVFLILAALIGLSIGGGLLFLPAQLQADNGIILSGASDFSETRAPGSAIFFAAIFSVISIFQVRLRRTALIIMSLFFLSYGLGRLLSLILDGMPAQGLFYAMIGELIMGAFAVILLIKIKPLKE